MAQVDKLNYIPLLFWFVFLFFCIYLLILTKIVPYFFSIFKARKKYYYKVLFFIKKASFLSCLWVKWMKHFAFYNSNKIFNLNRSLITQQAL